MDNIEDYLTTNKTNYYLGIYVDILGQGEKLAQMNSMPINEDENKQFYQILHNTVRSVIEVHRSFDKFLKSFQNIDDENDLIKNLSDNDKEKFLQSQRIDVKDIRFSDTMILYFSLDSESCFNPISRVYAALAATAAVFSTSLASGIVLRGAINIGIGTELVQSGLYGQILHSLHYLESNVADYPRIVIGQELINMIDQYQNEPNKDENIYLSIGQTIIPRVKRMIKHDYDGHPILHYLSEEFVPEEKDRILYDLYGNIKKVIHKQLIEHSNNQKVLNKYKKLNKYVRSNKYSWQLAKL